MFCYLVYSKHFNPFLNVIVCGYSVAINQVIVIPILIHSITIK